MAVLKTTSPSPRPSKPSASPTKARPSSRTSAAWRLLDGNDHRLVDAVLLGDEHPAPFRVRRVDVLSDLVGRSRTLAMPPGHNHRPLERPRSSEVHQRIHRRARSPSGPG